MMKRWFWVAFFTLFYSSLLAQTSYFTSHYQHQKLAKVLDDISKVFEINFSYSSDLIEGKYVSENFLNNDFYAVTDKLSFTCNISFHKINEHFYYITRQRAEQIGEVVIRKYLLKEIKKTSQGIYVLQQWNKTVLPGYASPDVIQALRQLPGVVGLDENVSNMMVRGGRSDENRLIFDYINLYHRGHLFGQIATVNPNVVDKLYFHNKGTLSHFGERISAVVDMHTPNFINNNWQTQVGVNGLFADAAINIPVINDKLSVQASVRRSYEELYKSKTLQKYENQAFQGVDLGEGNFNFIDFTSKINYKLNKNNQLNISLFGVSNYFENTYKIVRDTVLSTALQTENIGSSVGWRHQWKNKMWQQSHISYGEYQFDYHNRKTANTSLQNDFNKKNYVADAQLSSELYYQPASKDLLSAGYQASYKNAYYSFVNNKKSIVYYLGQKNTTLWQHSLFVNYTRKSKKNNYLYAGFRFNYFMPLQKILIEPRFVWQKSLGKYLALQLTGELKNQSIYQINETVNSNFNYGKQIWQLASDKDSPVIQAIQLSEGLTFTKNKWIIDADLYFKHIKNLRSLSMGLFNFDDPKVHIGTKKLMGLDLYVKKDCKKLKYWFAYSYVSALSRFKGINKDNLFFSQPQIKHNFSSNILYQRKKIAFSLGWYYQSGKGFTKVVNGKLSENINAKNLPSFHHLDFSMVYNFAFRKTKSLKGKIGLSLKNIYNNKEAIGYEYTGNNAINDPIRMYKIYAVGFTPDLMIRFFF